MKKIFLLLVVVLLSQNVLSQTALASKVEVAEHADKVMLLFGQSNYEDAFTELRKYYPVPNLDYETVKAKTIENISGAEDGFGAIRGEVFVKEEKIDDIALRRNYLLKLGTILLRFQLTYYNGVDGWIVNSFNWDDEFEVYFEE